MSMNYRLADMLAQIRNGQAARLAKVSMTYTKFLHDVASVLVEEGYVEEAAKVEVGKGKYNLEWLKFLTDKAIEEFPIISGMEKEKTFKILFDLIK